MPAIQIGNTPFKRIGGDRRSAVSEAEKDSRSRVQPKMTFVVGSLSVAVPYAPRATTVTGVTKTYNEVPRPGRSPLLLFSGTMLQKQSFTLFLGFQDMQQSVEKIYRQLVLVSNHPLPFGVASGPGAGTKWRMTSFSMAVLERQTGTNQITRCTIDIEMTQASELFGVPGPVKGGKPVPSQAPGRKTPGKSVPVKPPARTHIVKSGETLGKISNIYYGTPSKGQEIGKANRIADPNLIKIGQKLVIP